MDYPQTYTNASGTVTVYDHKNTFWGNTACKWVYASGDPEAYFHPDTEIFQMEERPDGTWQAWHYYTDPELIQCRDELVRLGAWT